MTRSGNSITPYGANVLGPTVRPDLSNGDERPFAEIRKNLNDALRIVSVHRWAFLVPFCMVSSGAFLMSLYYPRTYQATTVFERRNDPIMIDLPNAAGTASFRYFRSTMERDLTSVGYMGEAVENLRLPGVGPRQEDGTLPPETVKTRNSLARELAGTIGIATTSPSEHVDIIRLTYTGADPRLGARLLDEVKRTYVRRTMAWIRRFLESQRDYFQGALADAGEALKTAQHDQTRLRLESPHINPDDPSGVSLRIEALELERRELELRWRDADGELSSLRQMLAATAPVSPSADGLDDIGDAAPVYTSPETLRLIDQIQKTDLDIEKLRGARGVTDEHPEMKELIVLRRWAETELRRSRAEDQDTLHRRPMNPESSSRLMGGLAGLHPWMGERSRLAIQIATQEAKLRDLDISLKSNENAVEQLRIAKDGVYQQLDEYADIMVSVGKARQRHRDVLETLNKIEPAIKAIEQDRLMQFSEGEPARGSFIPVNPKATTILLLAILAGLAAGVAFVMLAEILDSVYHTSAQVARSLGLPILETIDVIVTSGDRRRLLWQRAVLSPMLLIAFLSLSGFTGVIAYTSIQRPWAFQKIRAIPQAAMRLFAQNVQDDAPKIDPGADQS